MTFVFQVSEHKTSDSRGPAIIALSPEIFQMLKNFIDMCKRIPNFQRDENRNLFTCWPKKDNVIVPMNSSQVNIANKRLWAQGPINKPISATKIRKATTTHVREANPGVCRMIRRPQTNITTSSSQKLATPTCKIISNVMEDQHPKQIQQSIHWPNDSNLNDIIEVGDSDNERIEKTVSYYDSEEELFGGPPSPLHTQDLIDLYRKRRTAN